jgi:hypothetical protein
MPKSKHPSLAKVGFLKTPAPKTPEPKPEAPKLEYNTVAIPAGPEHKVPQETDADLAVKKPLPAGANPKAPVAKIPEPKPTHSVVKLLVNYHPVLAYELIVSSAPTNISDTLKAGSTVKLDAEEAAGLIADGRAEAA